MTSAVYWFRRKWSHVKGRLWLGLTRRVYPASTIWIVTEKSRGALRFEGRTAYSKSLHGFVVIATDKNPPLLIDGRTL